MYEDLYSGGEGKGRDDQGKLFFVWLEAEATMVMGIYSILWSVKILVSESDLDREEMATYLPNISLKQALYRRDLGTCLMCT